MYKNQINKPLFDRHKSGYTREFNPLDVFIFNVMGFSLGLALSTNPPFIGGFAPNSNILIVIGLGAVLAFLNGLVYGWFGAIMPSTGGDFVFVTRSISHRIGFLTSWGFTLTQIYGMATNIGWIISMAVTPSLTTIGYLFDNKELINWAKDFSENFVFMGSIVIMLLYWLISTLGFSLNRVFAIIIFLLGMIGPFLIGWILYNTTHNEFVTNFDKFILNQYGIKDAYNLIIQTAKDSGMQMNANNTISESFRALPIGFLCFLGFTYSVYAGGEIEKPEKSQIQGILFALLLGLFTFIICMGKYVNIIGQEFHAALGNSTALEKIGLHFNSMNFIVGIISEKPMLNLFMQIGITIWFLLVPFIMLQVCTRNIIAWTCDGLLPNSFLKRTNTNSPYIASLAVTLLAIAFIVAINLIGLSLVGAVALAAVAYLFTSIGAMILPDRNPIAFAKLPLSAKNKLTGITSNFQLTGFICALGFLWIIYASVVYPEISGGSTYRAIFMILAVYISGLLFYEWRRKLLKNLETKANIDLEQLFKEIPED